MKDIKKVIKSWENGGALWKGACKIITSQEGGLINFLKINGRWFTINENVLNPLAKSVVDRLGLLAGISVVDAAI